MSTTFMTVTRGKFGGPFTYEQLLWMEQSGEINNASQVRVAGGTAPWSTWALIKADANSPMPKEAAAPLIEESFPQVRAFPPMVAQPQFAEDGPPLSRIAYIVLALFLGSAGIHNFYARRMVEGAGQLAVLVVAFLCLLIAPLLSLVLLAMNGLWAIFDIIATTRDGYDRDLV